MDLELVQHVLDVRPDGIRTETEGLREAVPLHPLREEREHLPLTAGQGSERSSHIGGVDVEGVRSFAADMTRGDEIAVGGAPYRLQELVPMSGLADTPPQPVAACEQCRVEVLRLGQQDDLAGMS